MSLGCYFRWENERVIEIGKKHKIDTLKNELREPDKK